MNRHGRGVAGAIAMLLVVPVARSAPQAHAAVATDLRGAIVVHVTDTSLNPLPAEVLLPALSVGARLSADGAVTFVDVPTGLYVVEVRHAGHVSDSRLLRVNGDTARVHFVLAPGVGEGGGSDGAGFARIARARLRYFFERSALMSSGTFITRVQIERRGARTVSAVLRGVRGVEVEHGPRGRTIVRSTEAARAGCAGGMLVFVDGAPIAPADDSALHTTAEQTARAHQPRESPRRLAFGGTPVRSSTLRWVGPSGADVVRVVYGTSGVAEAATAIARETRVTDIDRLSVSSVVALEVYSSPDSAPPEFQQPGAECGVVVIWTGRA